MNDQTLKVLIALLAVCFFFWLPGLCMCCWSQWIRTSLCCSCYWTWAVSRCGAWVIFSNCQPAPVERRWLLESIPGRSIASPGDVISVYFQIWVPWDRPVILWRLAFSSGLFGVQVRFPSQVFGHNPDGSLCGLAVECSSVLSFHKLHWGTLRWNNLYKLSVRV